MHNALTTIIPARGGSRGFPGKNIAPLLGQPLIAWTIRAALESQEVGRVVVTTDDARVAEASQTAGAEVLWRPGELASDTASSESALVHALHGLFQAGQTIPESFVFLQCTSPLTLPKDIDQTVQAMREKQADSAMTVAPFHHFLWQVDNDGQACAINHDKRVRQRRQDRDAQYVETGAVYAMRTAGFFHHHHRFFGTTAMHVTPGERWLEIDEPADLEVAQVRLRHRHRRCRLERLPNSIEAVVFDFDGVFTDNRVTVDEQGRESVACHRGDGMGLEMLRDRGIAMLVLSKEKNPVVAARCEKLRLECRYGIENKLAVFKSWQEKHDFVPDHVVYVGNEVNDLECLRFAGCGVAVADAHPDAASAARLTLENGGGQGAVRELTDLIGERLEECKLD